MIAKIPNLWPEQLGQTSEITPRAVLQRQGQILAERSGGAVSGELVSRVRGRECMHTMSIVAPEFDGFQYFVVRVRHGIDSAYPARVYISESEEGGVECNTEGEFLQVTRNLLHDSRITSVVHSLLMQVKAHPPAAESA